MHHSLPTATARILTAAIAWTIVLPSAAGCLGENVDLPGEVVVSGVFEPGEVYVDGDRIYWTKRAGHGYQEIYGAELSELPVRGDLGYLITSFGPPVIEGGAIYVNRAGADLGSDIEMRDSAGEHLATLVNSPRTLIHAFAIDQTGEDPMVIWSTGKSVSWRAFDAAASAQASLPGVDSVTSVVADSEFIWAGTHNALGPDGEYGELWRIAKATGEATRISAARDWADEFSHLDPALFNYVSAQLTSDELGLLWLVVARHKLYANEDRALLLEFPTRGGDPHRLLSIANEMNNTTRFFPFGEWIYWNQPDVTGLLVTADPIPLWRAPRQGGDVSAVGTYHVGAVTEEFVYGIYYAPQAASAHIRRVGRD